jgi:hypothetical protein
VLDFYELTFIKYENAGQALAVKALGMAAWALSCLSLIKAVKPLA